MADYNLKGVPDKFWYQVRVFALDHKITIKKLILKALSKEIKKDVNVE